ncbi:GPW/gp25 family protein [Chromobacterium vaccinii]|uniref:GPW/gp25 family protein n=1 Tax=Chromobacterium vaccinii TaxID=1108595 RepID=UPI0031CFF99D
MDQYAFLGQGWAFPPRFSQPGLSVQLAGEPLVQQSIRLILGTAPGERVMRADFGSQLALTLFAGIDSTTLYELEHSVQDALLKLEPRIDINSVSAVQGDDSGCVLLTIDYTVRDTNTRNNLVYPFYLTEASL